MAVSVPVGHVPVQVVPDAGCRVQVINTGDTVFYGPHKNLDPLTVAGQLEHDKRFVFDDPMWFMTGGQATMVVIQMRFCKHCGWVDGI